MGMIKTQTPPSPPPAPPQLAHQPQVPSHISGSLHHTESLPKEPDATTNGISSKKPRRAFFRRKSASSQSLSQLGSKLSSSGRRVLQLIRPLRPLFNYERYSFFPQLVLIHALAGIIISLTLALASTSFLLHTLPPFPSDVYQIHPMFRLYPNIAVPNSTTYFSPVGSPNIVGDIDLQLEQSFAIPATLSILIPHPQRYLLINLLQSTRIQRTNLSPKLFVLHVVSSNAESRCSAIASAITYARNTDRLLIILWDTAYGGHSFGPDAVTYGQKDQLNNFLFVHVHDLHLSPNVSHWSDYSIAYFTLPSHSHDHPLDRVADLASRHIFYRSGTPLVGKYADLSPGVMIMSRALSPGVYFRREWDSFTRRWTFPHLIPSRVSEILNRVYGVPRIFIDNMVEEKQRLLLRMLDRSSSKRALFIHTQYGLGNRLRALGSAMAIAKVTGRVLVLIWEPDVHLDCRFNDLFVNEYVIIEKFVMNWPPSGTATKDHAMQTVDFYNFMRNEGAGRHNPVKDLVNPSNGRHVYVKSAYVLRSRFTPRIISTRSGHWKIMREELVPQVEIMMLVLDPMFANIKNMIGVHIRARTIENDIKGVDHEFYGQASRTTDHWRKRTGLKTFENKIMRLNTKYNFFVAADTKESIYELEKRFGAHRFLSVPRDGDCVTRDVECAKLALVDILLLSRVSTLLGSHWSSFSEGAVRLSGRVKVLLAGIHFG